MDESKKKHTDDLDNYKQQYLKQPIVDFKLFLKSSNFDFLKALGITLEDRALAKNMRKF